MDQSRQKERFILRNSHRKLLKKTMRKMPANWLSSFLNQQMQPISQENSFSKAIKIHPKTSIMQQHNKTVPERLNIISQSPHLKERTRPHHNHIQDNRYVLNFENKRVRLSTACEIKQQNRMRNTTGFSNRLHHRSLLERETRKSVIEKLRTEPIHMEKIIKAKTNRIRQKEFLLLSPWGRKEDNKENLQLQF